MKRRDLKLQPGDRVVVFRVNGEVEVSGPASAADAERGDEPKPPPWTYLLGTGGTILGAAIGGPLLAVAGMVAGALTGHAMEKPPVVR